MRNDVFSLRFSGPGVGSEVELEQLVSFGRTLSHIMAVAFEKFATGVHARFFLVANPRLGSLELILRPEFFGDFNVNAVIQVVGLGRENAEQPVVDFFTIVGGATGVMSLAWQVIFQPNGIFEKWKKKTLEDAAKRHKTPSDDVRDRFEHTLITSAHGSEKLQAVFRDLVQAALRSPAERVEIRLNDSEWILIADRAHRRGAGKIAIHYERVDDRRNPERIVRAGDEQARRLRYRKKEYQSFLAEAVGQAGSIVVLWGSALALPRPGTSADVLSKVVDDPSQIEAVDDVPLEFEDAVFVILVDRAKGDWA